MLLQPYNELSFNITILTTSPLIVRESRFSDEDRKAWSGEREDVRKRMPNVIPISRAGSVEIQRAVLNANPLEAVGKLPFYIPAASLRGVSRSHLERALRSVDDPSDPRVCDPFEDREDKDRNLVALDRSCSAALTKRKAKEEERDEKTPFHAYTNACPACRLFGSTVQSSRIRFTDGERVPNTGALVPREHVRIDRRKGSVATPPGPLRFYGLQDCEFTFTMTLQNFELTHVFLLGLLLADLEQRNIVFGSGRNKGYGRVALQPAKCKIDLTYFGKDQPSHHLRGVGEHENESLRKWFQQRYGISSLSDPHGDEQAPQKEPESRTPPVLGTTTWSQPLPWRWTRPIPYKEFMGIWPKLPKPLTNTTKKLRELA